MLPFHNCYICGTWRSKEVGGLMLSYGGKGKSHKKRNFLWGATKKLPCELTVGLLYLESPTYFSLLWCKNIYALPTWDSFLLKLHKQSWDQFFLLDLLFYLHYGFFINLQMTNEWAFAFLNTALIIFCLMYSLHIQFRFWRHFTTL